MLNNEFVCCYTNIKGNPSAGASFSHSPRDQPGPCGRGAGRQNVQTMFMTPAGQIFHVATGYLDPNDLLDEARFARQLYADLRRNRASGNQTSGAQTVVAAHQARLEKTGFTPQQISAPENRLNDMLLAGPNPRDFGIQIPGLTGFGGNGANFGGKGAGPVGNPFADVARKRSLKDHKFVMANPLMTHKSFETDPRSLVGHGNSFFGSHSAMNGIGRQLNSPMNRRGGNALNRGR